MDHIENTLVSIVTVLLCASRFRGNVFTEPLLRNGSDISLFVSRSLPSNGSTGHNILITIYFIVFIEDALSEVDNVIIIIYLDL
jgi:hypothetical protein